jgi:flagellar protein FlaJ
MNGFTKRLQYLLDNSDVHMHASKFFLFTLFSGLVFVSIFGIIVSYVGYPLWITILSSLGLLVIFGGTLYAMLVLRAMQRVASIEAVLPDFLSLMASNLRSGLTPDRAFILSVRKEFGPLEAEIDIAAKEIVSGKSFTQAFEGMSRRIDSEIFAKAVRLIIEGVNSGGDLAHLLENTSLDIRRFSATKKDISATVRVYELFILAAAGIGAPLLYAVATFLVSVVFEMKEKLNLSEAASASVSATMPILGGASSAGMSPEIVYIFSIVAIAIGAFFGSLAAGVISKGKETEGYAYIPIMLAVAYAIFFCTRFLLDIFLGSTFF